MRYAASVLIARRRGCAARAPYARPALLLLLLAAWVLAGAHLWPAAASEPQSGCEAPLAVVRLPVTAAAAGGQLLLGQVAELEAAPDLRETLAQVSLGPAPLPGAERLVTLGWIRLRLRRAGLAPEGLSFQGASGVVVRSGVAATPVSAGVAGADGPTAAASVAPPSVTAEPVLRRGDRVTVVVRCGPIEVRALGQAQDAGALGEPIRVRILQTSQVVEGRIVGSEEVEVSA